MPRLELAPEVFDDFDRFIDHMHRFGIQNVAERIVELSQGLQILTHSPLIGRPVRNGERELVIGRDTRGYIVLYRFVASIDIVFVLAVRSQRETGFVRER